MGKLEEQGDEDRCPYNIVDMFGRRFKKDSRTWLHKNTRKIKADKKIITKSYGDYSYNPSQFGIVEHGPPRIEVDEPEDIDSSSSCSTCTSCSTCDTDSDNPYTIIDSMGRRFKKDSRTWLHKSSSKRKKYKIIEEEADDVPKLPEIPDTLPSAHFFLKDSEENSEEQDSKIEFQEAMETGNDISKQHHSNVLMRKRKQKSQQISNSANLPDNYHHNAEICMILSADLEETDKKPTTMKRSASFDNIFELFEEDAECAECQQMSNNSKLSSTWRETKPITSETSTLSSNENREINHSPLSSGASINLSSDTKIKRSPELSSAVKTNYHNNPGSINKTSNCEQYKISQTLNVNSSRSITYLIEESDEFLGDVVLSDYEEESD